MLSNVKKKDMPLIAISLVAILFIAATLSLFPQQSAQVANTLLTALPGCWVPPCRSSF